MALILLTYLLFNAVLVWTLTLPGLQQSLTPAAELGAALYGARGRTLVSLIIALSALGFLSVTLMAMPRVYRLMAQEGLFFASCARLHPVHGTPGVALQVQAGWTIALAVTGTYAQLLDYAVLGSWVFNALAVAGLLVLRKHRVGEAAGSVFRIPGYPGLPLVFVGICLAVALGAVVSSPLSGLAGTGLILLGVPVYYLWRRDRGSRGHGGPGPADAGG